MSTIVAIAGIVAIFSILSALMIFDARGKRRLKLNLQVRLSELAGRYNGFVYQIDRIDKMFVSFEFKCQDEESVKEYRFHAGVSCRPGTITPYEMVVAGTKSPHGIFIRIKCSLEEAAKEGSLVCMAELVLNKLRTESQDCDETTIFP